MKRITYFIVLSFVLVSGLACEEECNCAGTGQFEYMIFGHFYGECGGEGCVEIFKLDDSALYEDTTDVYPTGLETYAGQYVQLSEAKYQQVKDLLQEFPDELFAESKRVIGMPDAGDWGGIYVEIKLKDDPSLSGFWLLDQMESNMPQVYNEFVDKINAKIALINE